MDIAVVVEILVAVSVAIFALGHVLVFRAVFVGPAHERGSANETQHQVPMRPAVTAS